MLISALLSSLDEDHYLRLLVTNNDLKILLGHFVNFFLNIGIIRPIEDVDDSDMFMVNVFAIGIFKLDLNGPFY